VFFNPGTGGCLWSVVTCTLYSCVLTSVNGVSASQQGAPGWGADWLDVVVV